MKRFLFLLIMLSGIGYSAGAKESTVAILSPLTQQYLLRAAHTAGPVSGYVYRQDAAGNLFISALVQSNGHLQEESLRQIGAIVGVKAGAIWTVHVPLGQVIAFTQVAGAQYIQLDEPVYPAMDSVRKVTRVDSVHAGINLPMAFTGNNVVLGIMDVGFDYTHPLFYDTTGNRYRVRRIWEEKTTGTPPAGYSFGREITDTMAMRASGSDNTHQSHGTHVAGIAGGSGFGSSSTNSRFRGIGFNTDVVLVGITPPQSQWMNTGMSDLIEGMKYIYDYAASAGKPAVVNLSWGCSTGSHDGLSLFSKAVDALTGSGKLFVCSAGNTGADNIHLQKSFTTADTIFNTFISFSPYLAEKKTWIDIWGDTAKTFCAKITLYNGATAGNSTGFICLDNTTHSTYLIGSAGDTCFVDMTTSAADFNGKPRIFLSLRNKAADAVNLTLKSSDAKVNMWDGYVENSSGYYGAFTNGGMSWAVNGNTDMTTSDFSATKSAISVGAFSSRNRYTNISGAQQTGSSLWRIATFSSHGPTADSRINPDIAAPGYFVVSGVNSYDSSFMPGGSSYYSVFSAFPMNGKTYTYGVLSGTSMSSPAVSGIAALLLEANPNLTPQGVKDVLAQTAIIDTYTGALTPAGNNIWGHGKVNAYAAIRKVLQDLSVNQVVSNSMKWSLYPNPNSGVFTIACASLKSTTAAFEIGDVTGRIILQKTGR